MKRQALVEVVNSYIDQIEKYCGRMPGCFDQEDIHDLRVGYKKLRAFLRLLQLEADAGLLQIPVKLKAIYQSSGKVRDMQLFLAQTGSTPYASSIPSYLNCCNRQLFAYKEQAVQAIEAIHFKKTVQAIKKELPHQLHNDTVRKFMHQKIAAIHILLLAADDETDLHSTRKHLKDIIYNIRIHEQDVGIPFPVQAYSEKELNDLAGRLGDFNDCCIALSMLQSVCVNEGDEQEKPALQYLQKTWLHNKEEQQKQLLQQVQALKVEHEDFA